MDIFMDMAYVIKLPKSIPSDLVNLIAEIDEFKGTWQSLKNIAPDRLTILRKVATIASIGSSTRIEGSRLSDAEVEQLLSRIGRHSFKNRDEQEVAGYADAMNLVFDAYADIPVTENHIKQLHGTLLKYSEKDQRHRGEYKKLSNNVEAFDASGKRIGIVFETTTPFNTPHFMRELTAWYAGALAERTSHPLLLIAGFTVHFLAIHPFQDGNGRLSRILTTLLLLKQGYAHVPYCSLESIVEENKDRYFLSLRRAQTSFKNDHQGMEEWLRFFLTALKKQKDILTQRLDREKTLSLTGLPELQKLILKLLTERTSLKVADIVAETHANRNTVKKHLKGLVKSGLLAQTGIGKGTTYGRP